MKADKCRVLLSRFLWDLVKEGVATLVEAVIVQEKTSHFIKRAHIT